MSQEAAAFRRCHGRTRHHHRPSRTQTLTLPYPKPTVTRYSKANGGLVRMLSGISETGTDHLDTMSFASELKLGTNSPTIELPNDAEPSQEPLKYRLRVFVQLISLDWLASGDFGPYAGSVSARKPCGKCRWTPTCGCSYLASDDPRRLTMTHAPHCEGVAPRTHEVP